MTEITREQIEEMQRHALAHPNAWQTEDSVHIAAVCTIALKALEQPTPSQDTVEAVARAICSTDENPDEICRGKPKWTLWVEEAEAAIAAYEARRK